MAPSNLIHYLRAHRRLIAIASVGFVLRLIWMIHAHPEPVSDYQVYWQLGANLLDGGYFGLDQPTALALPGFPWLLAGFMLVSRSIGFLGFVMVVLSTAACLLVYLLALRLTDDESVALVAAAGWALNPTSVLYAPVLATEHLFVLLVLTAMLLALRLPDGDSLRIPIAVGLCLGFAILTRGEALFYVPAVGFVIWRLGRRLRQRIRIRQSVLVLAAIALVTVPWVVRNAVVVAPGFTLSAAGGMNFYFAHNPNHYGWSEDVPWPRDDVVAANRIGWELGLEYIRDNPVSVLESTRDGTYGLLGDPSYALFWSTQDADPDTFLAFESRFVQFEGLLSKILAMGAAVMLSLSLASFIAWRRWPERMRVLLPILILGNWLGYAVLFFGHPRFRYTAEAFLMVLVGYTVVAMRRSPSVDSAAPVTGPARGAI